MSRIWFTSDTHYGHANVIRFCSRPFATVEEMNAELLRRHNALVSPDDVVYHLGDFIWSTRREVWTAILDQLNGRFRVVRGNHDIPLRKATFSHPKIEWVQDYHEMKIDGRKVVLCHFPIGSWNRAMHGAWMLHGHCHGSYEHGLPRSREHGLVADVGVDCWAYAPVSPAELADHFDGMEPRSSRYDDAARRTKGAA